MGANGPQFCSGSCITEDIVEVVVYMVRINRPAADCDIIVASFCTVYSRPGILLSLLESIKIWLTFRQIINYGRVPSNGGRAEINETSLARLMQPCSLYGPGASTSFIQVP